MQRTLVLFARKFAAPRKQLVPTRHAPSQLSQQQQPSSPPAPVAPTTGGSLMDVVKEGFAFGIGSAIARNVVGSLWPGGGFGGGETPPPPPPQQQQAEE